MEYNLVSGDSHIDLSWLPGDLFVDNAPAHLKDEVPRVVDTEEGPRWVAEGTELGVAGGLGFAFTAPRRGLRYRIDRMYDAGYYEGGPHPSTPNLRLKDMEMDGVDAEVLYGMTNAGMRIKDLDLLTTTYRIYNEWVVDFCNTEPGRWYALACIPITDPVTAAEELRRAAKLGLRGADLYTSFTWPIYMRDGYWDPLWEAAEETGLPLSFHIGGGGIRVPQAPTNRKSGEAYTEEEAEQNALAYRGTSLTLSQLAGAEWLLSIIMSGTCEKFPGFQFVLGECGAGWVPFVTERLDVQYTDNLIDVKFDPPLSLKPSEYWYRQGATTFQDDPTVGYMAKFIGEDNLMWGSDYPHPDGVWPDSAKVIERTMGQLDEDVKRKIVCDNAVQRYRMGQ